jgi:hypothetical protein
MKYMSCVTIMKLTREDMHADAALFSQVARPLTINRLYRP